MSHVVHHTRALVLAQYPRREHDSAIIFFTEEFGRIHAHALGSRKESSKLRFALQPMTHIRLALVRGREVWRVTGAEVIAQPYYDAREDAQRLFLLRFVAVLRRLLAGEEAHAALYALAEQTLCALPAVPTTQLTAFEHVILLRTCTLLGYGPPAHDNALAQYLSGDIDERLLLDTAAENKALLVRHINKALAGSHL